MRRLPENENPGTSSILSREKTMATAKFIPSSKSFKTFSSFRICSVGSAGGQLVLLRFRHTPSMFFRPYFACRPNRRMPDDDPTAAC